MKIYYSKNGYLIKWDDLTQLKNGDYLFQYKIFDKTEIEIPFPNLLSCINMFYNTNITSFSGDLGSNVSTRVDGSNMFKNCTELTSFSGDLGSSFYGENMFYACKNLKSVSGDFSGLYYGQGMFSGCFNLTSFTSDLSSLMNGKTMFMGCQHLTSFTSDLSSLQYGQGMFSGCFNLTSFSGDLSRLHFGENMFYDCKLNKESVTNIINCLKNSNTCTWNSGSLTLGIDASLETDTELQTLLGITEGATSTTIIGHGGCTWTIKLQWN